MITRHLFVRWQVFGFNTTSPDVARGYVPNKNRRAMLNLASESMLSLSETSVQALCEHCEPCFPYRSDDTFDVTLEEPGGCACK
jgi:hypothetical protein